MLGFLKEKIRETANGPGAPIPAPEKPAQSGWGDPENGWDANAQSGTSVAGVSLRVNKKLKDERDEARDSAEGLALELDRERADRDRTNHFWWKAEDQVKRLIEENDALREAHREDLKLMQDAAGRAQDKAAEIQRDSVLSETDLQREISRLRSVIDKTIEELENERDAHETTEAEFEGIVKAYRDTVSKWEEIYEITQDTYQKLLRRNRQYEQEVYAAGREIERLRERLRRRKPVVIYGESKPRPEVYGDMDYFPPQLGRPTKAERN